MDANCAGLKTDEMIGNWPDLTKPDAAEEYVTATINSGARLVYGAPICRELIPAYWKLYQDLPRIRRRFRYAVPRTATSNPDG